MSKAGPNDYVIEIPGMISMGLSTITSPLRSGEKPGKYSYTKPPPGPGLLPLGLLQPKYFL
jgi:hypothetical protein